MKMSTLRSRPPRRAPLRSDCLLRLRCGKGKVLSAESRRKRRWKAKRKRKQEVERKGRKFVIKMKFQERKLRMKVNKTEIMCAQQQLKYRIAPKGTQTRRMKHISTRSYLHQQTFHRRWLTESFSSAIEHSLCVERFPSHATAIRAPPRRLPRFLLDADISARRPPCNSHCSAAKALPQCALIDLHLVVHRGWNDDIMAASRSTILNTSSTSFHSLGVIRGHYSEILNHLDCGW